MKTPNPDEVQRVVDDSIEEMLSRLDAIGATVEQLDALGEHDVAEWYVNWIESGVESEVVDNP